MSSTVNVNSTVRTTVTFRSFVNETEQGYPEDPVTLTVTVTDDSATPVVETLTPIYVSEGVYYADWTPTQEGSYVLSFLGVFVDDTQDEITQDFEVISEDDSEPASTTLGQDYIITFAAGLSPLYLAPEELQSIFEDAPMSVIAEEVFIASSEVKKMLKLADDITEEDMPLIALEYVRAAAACKLSKVYETEEEGIISNFRLGDLQVITQPINKSKINRGNATTWCELAYALRNEMLGSSTGFKSATKALSHPNPIPRRHLRSI